MTVGYIYMLKLHHLVDDKIHARAQLVHIHLLHNSRSVKGGNLAVSGLVRWRSGHLKPMVPLTLQEMLTVKSDDVSGRTKVYEAIVRGDDDFEAGIPRVLQRSG